MNPTFFLIQMLPLIVFIIIDTVTNNIRLSIVSAVVFAAGQLVCFYMKTGRFDWFVLLDAGLIVVLGAVSVVLKNDLFFKIKPAIIEAITVVFLFVLIAAPETYLLGYFNRMLPAGMTLNPLAIGTMKSMLVWMCVYVLLHIGAVLYTAFYSSRRVWAFVSGPGVFLLFIPVVAVLFVKKNRRRMKAKSQIRQAQR